jgi:beta-lactamase regulating signal transducer with metallopeptidase domain
MTHTLEAIAWTLIHFCWQAAAVAVVYRLLSLGLARATSQSRYLLAMAALMVMLALSVGTFAVELRSTSPSPFAAPPAAALRADLPAGNFPRTMAPGILPAQSANAGLSFAAVLPWIDALWILGVVALSLRTIGGWWLIQRLRASATVGAPAAVHAAFARLSAAMGLRRPVLLRVSSAIAGPVTVGALRALVLLPLTAATSLSPDELEVVLAHELAHVRRADFLWNMLQTLVETLFFFHPAVWWLSARIRHERELCCDDLALQFCPNPVVYAHALYRLEQQRSRHWRLAMALDGHQSPQTLRMRIARILGEPASLAGSRGLQPFSLVVACAALAVLLFPAPQVLASLNPLPHPAANPAPAAHPLPKPSAMHPMLSAQAQAPPPAPQAEATAPDPQQAATPPDPEEKPAPQGASRPDYIDRMKAAGYDVDLDKLMAMKIQDITPEYARAMSQLGFGKLSADDLIACKIQDVTPEFIAHLKQGGVEVKSIQDAISYRIFEVTPEFIAQMKAAGFDNLNSKQLLTLRVQGVTAEYAKTILKQYPGATVDDIVKTKIFNIDDAFIAQAKRHGFTNLSLDRLVQLRISGILDGEDSK